MTDTKKTKKSPKTSKPVETKKQRGIEVKKGGLKIQTLHNKEGK